MSYPGALSKGIRSKSLSGDYAPDEALGKLLADTGLTWRYTAANTVTVEPAPKATASDPQSATLGKVTVSATAKYDANDPYNPDYNRPNASTATRTD
ncbi:MAG: secretin and TonB N-terminal domain-containing protein, partial [Methylococcales bacterium]